MRAVTALSHFKHTHDALTRSVAELTERFRLEGDWTSARREDVVPLLEQLRDELLAHFADEEEALFPFLRRAAAVHPRAIENLETSHDAICGAIVRLAHLTAHGNAQTLRDLFLRFEKAYVDHAREEATLLDDVVVTLTERDREELTSLLDSLSS